MSNSLIAHGGLTEGSHREGKGREGSKEGKGSRSPCIPNYRRATGGNAMTSHDETAVVPELLWHWSPRSNRASIEEHGLTPGNLSSDGDWHPPHVCLARNAREALALCHGKPPLDLWLVHRRRLRRPNAS